ncbi:MAG: hypothetical protein HUU54_09265 [Ignavibacteriaceae bacterium]|nr:hypothetical protein [Ignavibacteriaceae bacterium]
MKYIVLNYSKYLFVILVAMILFQGCDKEYDGVIQPQTTGYTITDLTGTSTFTRTETDSVLTLFIKVSNPAVINGISVDMRDPDDKRVTGFPVPLLDNGKSDNGDLTAGDGVYSNNIIMSRNYLNGTYYLEYSIAVRGAGSKPAASQTIIFNNGQNNIAPVLSNLTAPDTLTVSDTTLIFMTIEASDSNGLNDIERVYFKSFRPDGTTSGATFSLVDNGRDGDATANDGIYSVIISVNPSNQKGTYTFEFEAIDRGKKKSNIVTHRITLL